jgi:hypothetical protein
MKTKEKHELSLTMQPTDEAATNLQEDAVYKNNGGNSVDKGIRMEC